MKCDWKPRSYRTVKSFYDAAARAVVVRFAADTVPSCTLEVVTSMHAIYDEIAVAHKSGVDIAHVLMSSEMRGIFNMGGDLGFMVSMARARDRPALVNYGCLSASLIHRTWDALGLPVTTLSAVDGEAFGGGCEAALSANIVVASKASRFAFPEVRFGLFPGMGATSLIGRRISPAYAANMILDARKVSADVAAKDGLIDRVVARNTEKAVLRTLARMSREKQMHLAELAALRRRNARYSHEEAIAIVMIWAEAVLDAPERSLAHMARIVSAQKSRLARHP